MAPTLRYRPTWHAEYLDALRGLAVLAVIVVHVGTSFALPWPWVNLAYSGQRGVQLFFVVSAFTLLLSHDNRRAAELRPTLNFAIRRFLRIAPMYYVAMLLTAALNPGIAGSRRDQMLGLLFLQGFSPTSIFHVGPGLWTVADEMLFYALLPFLVRQIRSFRSALLWFLAVAPAMAVLSFALEHRTPAAKGYFGFFWFPVEFPIFLLGIIAYFFWQERLATVFPRSSARAKRLSLTMLGIFALVYVLNLPLDNRKLYFSGLGCALLLLALALHPWQLFVNRITIFMGRISFSVYLLHAWAMDFVLHHTATLPFRYSPLWVFMLRFAGTLLITCLVAFPCWLFIEERGIGIGRRLIRRMEQRLPTPAASAALYPLVTAVHGSSPDEQF